MYRGSAHPRTGDNIRIAIADNTGLKFSQDIKEHWEAKGHEVRYERGASEYLAQWADLYYIEWIDNNLNYLWKLYNGIEGVSRTPDWDNNKKPKIVVRMIDWDIWNAYVPFYEQPYMDFIDQAICMAPHIEKYIRQKADYGSKLTLIKPGVNLSKWTSKTTQTDGFQLGMVLGDMWWYKNVMGGLDIFATLAMRDPRWRLHIRGQHEPGAYNPVMFEEFLKIRGLQNRVTLYPPQDDMNTWYENIDILLHPGMKEAFCYAVAEAATKGIPVVVNHFYGADEIWHPEMLYKTHEQAIYKIRMGHWLKDGRKYIEDNYSLERMLKEYDALLGT